MVGIIRREVILLIKSFIFTVKQSSFLAKYSFSTTCQVRVVRFYQSCSPPPPPHPPPPSPPRLLLAVQIPVGTVALPDLHRELQIPVGTAGPPPRAPDPSGHCRTSTATSRLQWALPDLNRDFRSQWGLPHLNRDFQIAVGTAGPQPRLPDRSGHCRNSTGRKDVR